MMRDTMAARASRRALWAACALAALLVGCTPREETMGASITGYNHTLDQSLYYYTVNGNMGANLVPESGGGHRTCCVSIPRHWKPGIKVKVWWHYAYGTALPPEPPPHVAEVELPPYKLSDVGSVQVHFYPDQKIKVVVSRLGIRNPDYPADLTWDAPTPADAVAGAALPFPPEENREIRLPLLGESAEQAYQRWSAAEARAVARRQAKQARWDALVARKVAGLPIDPSTLPPLLPREPTWEPGRVQGQEAAPAKPLASEPRSSMR